MAFGRRPLTRFGAMTRGGVAAAALALFVAGCGGGGGGSDPDPGPASRATITGRIVNGATGAAVPGARVTYGDRSEVSGADGAFSLTVPAPSPAQALRVSAANYYSAGQYNGATLSLATAGIPIPELAPNQTFNLVGNIQLFSTDSPPPPPTL